MNERLFARRRFLVADHQFCAQVDVRGNACTVDPES